MTRWRRLQARVGRRGAALLAFAFIDYVLGWGLLDSDTRAQTAALPSYRALLDVAPLGVWAGLWLAVAAACTVSAFLRYDAAAFAAAIGIKVVWAGGMYAAWALFNVPRAWLGAAVWGVLAALVGVISGWAEPRRP